MVYVSRTLRTTMQIGLVVGQAVSTVKHPSMKGWRLLVIQLLGAEGKGDGEPIVAIDSMGAGIDDRVLVSNDGAGTRQLIGDKKSPVRWMVMGLCDS
jgi:ethanolamine utilization protein EutN